MAYELGPKLQHEMAVVSEGRGGKQIVMLVDGDLIPVESVQWDPENDVFIIVGTQ
jgi:hypothetical protein